jgi:hypothetical protein
MAARGGPSFGGYFPAPVGDPGVRKKAESEEKQGADSGARTRSPRLGGEGTRLWASSRGRSGRPGGR